MIETRIIHTRCIQCDGEYKLREHVRDSGIRRVDVKCVQCGTPRSIWFEIVTDDPN